MAHGLQVLTTYSFLIIMFRASLQSYFKITTIGMKRSTLQQHKEAAMLCGKGMTIREARNALSIPHNTKQVVSTKIK